MIALVKHFYDQFNVSAEKVVNFEAPETAFEKFHLWTLKWQTPILISLVYVAIASLWSSYNRLHCGNKAKISSQKRVSTRSKKSQSDFLAASEESRFTPFKCLVILHNIILCLYSFTTFASVIPLLSKPYFYKPMLAAFCDIDKSTFNSGVNFWVWNFYVSKYYELLDTAILLLKGKPSSFLQTFHHSGSIMGMWLLTTTHAPAAWIFVLFNSFIHTVMYLYYTLTCFGYRPTWKKILTQMQIVQFLVGNPLGLLYAILPGCFPEERIPPENVLGYLLGSQAHSLYICLIVNTVFISGLVVLFTDFSKKTYGDQNVKVSEKAGKKPSGKNSASKPLDSLDKKRGLLPEPHGSIKEKKQKTTRKSKADIVVEPMVEIAQKKKSGARSASKQPAKAKTPASVSASSSKSSRTTRPKKND